VLVPGTSYRVEALVTFGNAGLRGGGGATASSIDVDGNGSLSADEANVRTVPCRVTLAPLPAAPEECNGTVTVSDLETDVTTTGTVTASNPQNFGSIHISDTTSFEVSVEVNSGTDGGTICNAASLTGASDGGTLAVITGYTPDEFVDVTPDDLSDNPVNIGHLPIYATYTCCVGADLSAEACADVGPLPPEGFKDGDYCTYSQGGFQGKGVPGDLYDANFLAVFPGGLTIGIADDVGPKHNATWTEFAGQTALKSFLGGGGTSAALTADTLNATSVSGGTLANQTAALTLNVGFNDAGVTVAPDNDPKFGDLTLCNLAAGSVIGSWTLTAAQAAALNGTAIRQVLADANTALSGSGLPDYVVGSFGNLNQLVSALNVSFHECKVSAFATTYLCVP